MTSRFTTGEDDPVRPLSIAADAKRVPPSKRRGRAPGSGYQRVDAPLIQEMHRLIQACEQPTPEAAARSVANRAYGGGSWDSKVDRLAKRYREQFRSPIHG